MVFWIRPGATAYRIFLRLPHCQTEMKGERFPLPKKGWGAASGSQVSAVCRWIGIFLPSAWSADQALTQIFLRFTSCMFNLPDWRVLRNVLGCSVFTIHCWNP